MKVTDLRVNCVRWFAGWCAVAAVGWQPWIVRAAGPSAETVSEVQQLRLQLQKAREEIEALRLENTRLKAVLGPATNGPVPVAPPSAPPLRPVRNPSWTEHRPRLPALSEPERLPAPIEEGSLVEADQLLTDYHASVAAADARYRGRRIRVEGEPTRLAKTFVTGVCVVRLKGRDTLGEIRCQVTLVGFAEYRISQGNGAILGRGRTGDWQTVVRVGAQALVEGVCDGVRDDAVALRDGRVVARP